MILLMILLTESFEDSFKDSFKIILRILLKILARILEDQSKKLLFWEQPATIGKTIGKRPKSGKMLCFSKEKFPWSQNEDLNLNF